MGLPCIMQGAAMLMPHLALPGLLSLQQLLEGVIIDLEAGDHTLLNPVEPCVFASRAGVLALRHGELTRRAQAGVMASKSMWLWIFGTIVLRLCRLER